MSGNSKLSRDELIVLPGAREIFDWLGRYPNFHDSYLIGVHLSAWSSSFIELLVYRTFDGSPSGSAVVTIALGKIISNNLTGLMEQLLGVSIYLDDNKYRIEIEGAHEVNGIIETNEIAFQMRMWSPDL